MRPVFLNVSAKPYTESRLDKEAKEFISKLLEETQGQFRECFLEMANSNSKKDRRKFLSLSASLAELVLPRPVTSYNVDKKELEKLIALFEGDNERERTELLPQTKRIEYPDLIVCKAIAGADINRSIMEALTLRKDSGKRVTLIFNEVDLVINEDDTVDSIYDRYSQELDLRNIKLKKGGQPC